MMNAPENKMNPAIAAKLEQARALKARIDALTGEMEDLLEPIVSDVMANGELKEMMVILDELPPGIHKTELRNHYNRL
jgi:anti-sigma factor ChrR (cupin superfamily)